LKGSFVKAFLLAPTTGATFLGAPRAITAIDSATMVGPKLKKDKS